MCSYVSLCPPNRNQLTFMGIIGWACSCFPVFACCCFCGIARATVATRHREMNKRAVILTLRNMKVGGKRNVMTYPFAAPT